MEFHNHIIQHLSQPVHVSGGRKSGTRRCCLWVHQGSNCRGSLGIGATVEDQPFGRVLEQEVAALERFDLQSPRPVQRAITRLMWELEEGYVEMELAKRSRRSRGGPFTEDL